ncbi:Sir2 histone deacetylase Hst2 [Toensbergia leucococca]|nr:Sir2 histone deacetylase Hst2 [Toensbergia leucococca]
MGQESSALVDEHTPPRRLKARSLDAVVKYIKDGHARNIVVMTGAGISTSAGIPDFRSPTTGLYANLARLNLPYAEAVFDISYFRTNPEPFYALAHEIYPGKYRPTISHSFVRLLFEKGLLLKVFTQNIDCLEREAGVPDDKIVEAHGSFARQCCIECKTPYPHDLMKEAIEKRNVPHCLTPQCNGLVKPEIVFFGEGLPEEFHKNRALPTAADLCIVMGTSLSVQPFASLPDFCSEGVPRVLLNLEHVGSLGSRPDDVLLLGDCDAGVRKLASALGWLEELEAVWIQTSPDDGTKQGETTPIKSKDEILEDEIAKLTKEVDKSLQISSIHTASLRDDLSEIQKKRLHANAIKGTDSSGGSSHSYPSDVTISSSTDQKKPAVDDLQISRSKERTATDVGESKGSLLEHVLSHNEGKSSL